MNPTLLNSLIEKVSTFLNTTSRLAAGLSELCRRHNTLVRAVSGMREEIRELHTRLEESGVSLRHRGDGIRSEGHCPSGPRREDDGHAPDIDRGPGGRCEPL